ncbi:MAG: acetyl-CoA C-acyltransferase [Legionellales bacterium]|nr:acetyl-CoA C-acyltransferase [Legionellales bacterium]
MTKLIQDAYIATALRTPVGKARGVFQHVRPDDLAAHVIAKVMEKNPQIPKEKVDDVILGCAMPEAEQGMNVARIALLLAGLPDTVPGMTVNRFCCSGIQTVALAAERIMLGHADVIIAGGTESMTMVPMGGNKFGANPNFFTNQGEHENIAYGMGLTAELVAEKYHVSREEQDAFALESHRRALKAIEMGEFKDEIAPIMVRENFADLETGEIIAKQREITLDEGPRAGSTMEQLAKLKTVFKANGTVTAGNTSQMSDGAGALLVVSEQALKDYDLTPLARFITFNVAGVPPQYMGIGPIAAIPKALKAANLSLDDIDWIELNEAFAAQTLAVMKEVKLDPAKTNPLGGAISWGHPLGATGAIRSATLLHGLRRHQLKYGLVTMCIGTGMGAAGIYEAL